VVLSEAIGPAIYKSRFESCLSTVVQCLRQATYTCVPLSPSSITWYGSKGGDALRLGR